jgi:hypothetical protein
MKITTAIRIEAIALGVAILAVAGTLPFADNGNQAGEDDISGVVTGPNGPEAGVWVIAETTELPTKFVRIVVTDDRGRYVIPDLPRRNTAFGSAAMASSIHRSRSRRSARPSTSRPFQRPLRPRQRSTILPAIGCRS